jgi:hypothetical protein
MHSKDAAEITFITNPGVILDRILTIFAHKGRDVAMKSLVDVVRADVQAQAAGGGYTPRTLLWYVIGARVSGDASFYADPEFVNALALREHESALFRTDVSGIELFRSTT